MTCAIVFTTWSTLAAGVPSVLARQAAAGLAIVRELDARLLKAPFDFGHGQRRWREDDPAEGFL